MDAVVPPAAEQYGINVLGVALTDNALPLHMLNLMRNYKGAVLVSDWVRVGGAVRVGEWPGC